MHQSRIQTEINGHIAKISLHNPPGNLIDRVLLEDLDSCIDRLFADREVKVILLTGSGKSFSQGIDIAEISEISSAGQARAAAAVGQKLFMKIENGLKPVIAAINGFCLGAGLELAMSCHIRIASDRAVLGMPEGNLGMIPSFGGTRLLPALVGRSRATWMILSGESLRSTDALAFGLVDRVVPKETLLATAMTMAGKLAARSVVPMAQALRAISGGIHLEPAEARELECICLEDLYNQHDIRTDLMTFLENSSWKKPEDHSTTITA